ncbi:MAG: DinB family protein [Saprospiraceae bacterium]
MESAKDLATRFREVVLDGKWIANTNFQDRLTGVTLPQASRRIGSLNSIAMLTYHIHYYIAGVLNVLRGGDLVIRDRYSFDLPELNTEEAWDALRQALYRDAEAFAGAVEQLSEEQLDSTFVDEKYGTYRRNIEGIIEHSYYHLGQVSLIRKLVE